jgi:hypothetical protein
MQSPKLGNACGFGGIPSEYLRHFSGSPFVHLTLLFNHCFRHERKKNHKPAETRQRPKMFTKFIFDQPLAHNGKTIREADFKNN